MASSVKISVLDLMPHRSDQSQHQTMLNTIDAARAAESFGYERFWVAEHHNAGSLLSSATVVVMAEVAAATERIRVGSGGIMLPNHSPYVVAEQFGTLNAFHPGRIDLGLGRAGHRPHDRSRAAPRRLSRDELPRRGPAAAAFPG